MHPIRLKYSGGAGGTGVSRSASTRHRYALVGILTWFGKDTRASILLQNM
jgi:hypothetical protein